MTVLYVSPMPYGANAAVDAVCHGLDNALAAAGTELRLLYADFAAPGWQELAAEAVDDGTEAGAEAIVLWIIDPAVPAGAVARARAAGIPVVTQGRAQL